MQICDRLKPVLTESPMAVHFSVRRPGAIGITPNNRASDDGNEVTVQERNALVRLDI